MMTIAESMFPRIIEAGANRAGEGVLSIRVCAEVHDDPAAVLQETHEVAGDRLLVVIRECPDEPLSRMRHPAPAIQREWHFQIPAMPLQIIRYVDIYGGGYNTLNARRIVLARMQVLS